VITLAPEEMFYRMARFREFDVSELSLSTYTVREGPAASRWWRFRSFPSFSFATRRSSWARTPASRARDWSANGWAYPVPMTAACGSRDARRRVGVAPKDLRWFEGGEGSKVKEVD